MTTLDPALFSEDPAPKMDPGLFSEEPAPEAPGRLESLARGAAQGATFGHADEISGGVQSTWQKVKDYLMAKDDGHTFTDNYREARDKSRKEFKAAQEANPWTYGAGNLAGGAATTLLAGPEAGLAKLAALGALSGEGSSEADLTQGDVGGVAKDAAVGGALGLGTGIAFKGAGALMDNFASEQGLRDIAEGRGAAALGYTKRLLNTPDKAAAARSTAGEMLDKGVITPFASPEDMAGRVDDLIQKSGQGIGDFLRSRGTGFQTSDAVESINALRPKDANGQWLTGGQYDKVHAMLDNAIDTVRAHGDTIPFEEANKLKGFLQDMVNWNSTKLEGNIGRGVAGSMREALDTSLEKAAAGENPAASMAFQGNSPDEGKQLFEDFLANKKTYGAGMQAQDALANRLSSEAGNKTIGLTDTITGAGELAAGNPVGAVAAVAGKKAIERYGNQTVSFLAHKGANIAQDLGRMVQENPQTFGRFAGVLQSAAQRGPQALAASHFLMMEKDPEYRQMMEKIQEGGQ